MALRVLNTKPKIGFELYREGMFANSVFIRLFRDQGVAGFEDDKRTSQESIMPNADGELPQLRDLLIASGVPGIVSLDDARVWLANTPREEAMKAIAKGWAVICAFLQSLFNRHTEAPNPTGTPFGNTLELFQAMLDRTVITEPDATGDVKVIPPTF